MRKLAGALILALFTAFAATAAPASAAGPDSWAHVWDADQTSSYSGSSYLRFSRYCPASFHAEVEHVRWVYSSPEGSSVNILWTELRIRPNHHLTVRFENQIRHFPADETTTRRFYDEGDTSAVEWDGGNAVGANFRLMTYGQNASEPAIDACRHPEHLAGLKKMF